MKEVFIMVLFRNPVQNCNVLDNHRAHFYIFKQRLFLNSSSIWETVFSSNLFLFKQRSFHQSCLYLSDQRYLIYPTSFIYSFILETYIYYLCLLEKPDVRPHQDRIYIARLQLFHYFVIVEVGKGEGSLTLLKKSLVTEVPCISGRNIPPHRHHALKI